MGGKESLRPHVTAYDQQQEGTASGIKILMGVLILLATAAIYLFFRAAYQAIYVVLSRI